MKLHHFSNQNNDFTLACPVTGRLIFDQGRFLKEENADYGIPLTLLPSRLLRHALQKPAQWEAWQEQRRLTLIPRSKMSKSDPFPFQAISIRPSSYGEYFAKGSPEKETIPLVKIIASPKVFANHHQKLAIQTDLFTHDEKMDFLKAAHKTITRSASQKDLPSIARVQLTDLILKIPAHQGYNDPTYHLASDDAIYFNYLRAVPDDSLTQALEYLETLSDEIITYAVKNPQSETDLYVFEDHDPNN